jgi:ParB family chromosome partitioning protein
MDNERHTMNNIATDLTSLATPLDGLKPLPGNPRKGDVDAVMRSYERFGQRKPIVALRDGTVIAGNHQLEAAKRLGWDAIAVVFTDDDESTAKAYALADNRVGELGGYDDQALLELLLDVDDVDDLLSATGYDVTMIDDLRNKLVAPSLDDLTSKYGELDEDSGDLWPSIKIKVPADLFNAWNDLVERCDKDAVKAFAFLMDEALS